MAPVRTGDGGGAGVSYVDRLADELDAVGIRGSSRSRILLEITDHLSCDPDAELGSARALARQFADELGSSLAGLRAAVPSLVAASECGRASRGLPGTSSMTSPGSLRAHCGAAVARCLPGRGGGGCGNHAGGRCSCRRIRWSGPRNIGRRPLPRRLRCDGALPGLAGVTWLGAPRAVRLRSR